MHFNKTFCRPQHNTTHLIKTNIQFFITLAVKALLVSMFSINDFFFSHERTECVFGFALTQNAEIISRLESITCMFAFLNPRCNSSRYALGCNKTKTSIMNTQLKAPIYPHSPHSLHLCCGFLADENKSGDYFPSLLWLREAVLFFNKLENIEVTLHKALSNESWAKQKYVFFYVKTRAVNVKTWDKWNMVHVVHFTLYMIPSVMKLLGSDWNWSHIHLHTS